MRGLDAAAAEHGFTWASAVSAAWGLLLSRYGYTDDVVFGVTRACRNVAPSSATTVGCLINTVPLRLRMDPQETTRDYLARVRRASLAQRDFETLGLRDAALLSALDDPRELVRTVVVCEDHTLAEALRGARPELVGWDFQLHGQSAVPLTLAFYRTEDGGADVVVEHDAAVVDPVVALSLGPALRALLEQFVARPLAPVGSLTLEGPRSELLGPLEEVAPGTAAAQLSDALAAHRARVALFDVASQEELTYGALRVRSESLAAELREHGCQAGDVVAVFASRGVDPVVALVACQLGGFTYLAIDPSYPAERIRFMLQDADAKYVLAQSRPDAVPPPTPVLPPRGLLERRFDVTSVHAETVAYLLYTSGSTGEPKGVRVPQRALMAHASAALSTYALSAEDSVLQFASPSVDVFLEEVVPTLLAGARLVVRDEDAASSPARLLGLARAQRITVLQLPTAFFHELAWHQERRADPLPPAVRLLVIGGERVSSTACRRFRAIAPRTRLVNAYGPTEVTITSTCYDVGTTVADQVPIGTPFGTCRAYVLDRHGHVAPRGAWGELALGGPQVALGYHRRPDETAQRFVSDPLSPARGPVYRTGDLARMDPGNELRFEGRIDAQVKVRGFRIELGEVERALEHDASVAEAAAAVLSSPAGEPVLVAFVVATDGDVGERTLLRDLARRVPAHMVPTRVFVVPALPRGPGGKLDRRALTWPAETPARVLADADATPAALQLRDVFREVLDDPGIGQDDGFFDRGGTSIRALRLVARIEEVVGAQPTIATLIANPTPRMLAQWLAAAPANAPVAEIVPLNTHPAEGRDPLYCVVGLHAYAALARQVESRAVYGVFVPEELDFPGATLSVSGLAARYLRAVESRGEPAPRLLLGISFGAFVALEMARELEARGAPPALVVLLDPRLPSMLESRPLDSLRNLAAHLRLNPAGVPARAHKRLRHMLTSPPARQATNEDQAQWAAREAAYARALEAHEPKLQPYRGPVQVYVARDEKPGRLAEVKGRWRSLLGPRSELVVVPGRHGNLLNEPYVGHIASVLNRTLRRGDADPLDADTRALR